MKPVRLGSVWIPPLTAIVLGVLLVSFLVAGVLVNFVPSLGRALDWLPVTTAAVLRGEVWRLVSYALLHDLTSPFHLLVNGLSIFFFGRELEVRWGTGRSLVFLFSTILVGGLFVVAAGLLLQSPGTVGASAYALGLWIAWGLTWPDRELRLFFAIPMKGSHAVWVALFFWLLDAVSLSPVSAAAHLGGIVTAVVLVRGVWRPNYLKAAWASLLERLGMKKKPKLYVVPAPHKGPDGKWVN